MKTLNPGQHIGISNPGQHSAMNFNSALAEHIELTTQRCDQERKELTGILDDSLTTRLTHWDRLTQLLTEHVATCHEIHLLEELRQEKLRRLEIDLTIANESNPKPEIMGACRVRQWWDDHRS